MKKKLLSLLLVGAMAATVLAGCGGDSDEEESSQSAGPTTTVEQEAAVIDMDEDPYEVAIQVVVLPGTDYSELEAQMEENLNAITLPAINCTVDIQFEWISEISTDTQNAIIGGDKLDLLHVATVSPLSSMVGQDILYDMNTDDLLQTHGQDLITLYGDLLNTGYVNGQQLAIPAKQYNVTSKGIYYNKTVADELNITLPETGTLEDLEAAFDVIMASDYASTMMCYYVGNGQSDYMYWLEGYDGFGTTCCYGAILDEQSGNTTIENLFASDAYRDYVVRMKEWREKGYITKDTTDETTAQDYYNAQQLFSVVTDITPTLEAQYKATSLAAGFESEFMTLVDPAITNSAATEYMWGIANSSERPDKAMDLLNFLYTADGAAAADILMYGIEGSTYERTSDQVVATNGSYLASFMVIGNQDAISVQSPADETSIDEWHTLMSEATTSVSLGYMFDDSDYQTEQAAISSTITQYMPSLEAGMVDDVDAYLAEFNTALSDAGIDDVIAANQEQLDAFLAK